MSDYGWGDMLAALGGWSRCAREQRQRQEELNAVIRASVFQVQQLIAEMTAAELAAAAAPPGSLRARALTLEEMMSA